MPRKILVILFLLLVPLPAFAEQFPLAPGVDLQLDLPGPDWQFRLKPPEFLVLETVAHVRHHLAEEGKETPDGLPELVRKRLAQNELFVVRAQTTARLLVDFSPSQTGDPPPDPGIIEQSARFAASELENESDLSQVQTTVAPGSLTGVEHVWEVQASYRQDGEPRQFLGLISYVGGGWLFLYYTDLNRDGGDFGAVRGMLDRARVIAR